MAALKNNQLFNMLWLKFFLKVHNLKKKKIKAFQNDKWKLQPFTKWANHGMKDKCLHGDFRIGLRKVAENLSTVPTNWVQNDSSSARRQNSQPWSMWWNCQGSQVPFHTTSTMGLGRQTAAMCFKYDHHCIMLYTVNMF